jgi:hypothetical protein
MKFPRFLVVRQNFPDRSLKDITGEVTRQLAGAGFDSRLKPGAKVAIGVGSRGIANIAAIVRSVVGYWKSQSMQPFIFPAMGSHGSATAEGQAEILAHYGIHEAAMGCPVISSLEVVQLGATPEGIKTYLDRAAYSSDGIFLVNRVKRHTDFDGKIESGLCKMMVIGLGKFAGARQYHTFAYKIGLERVIRSVAREVLQSGKILGGLAIVEDENHSTARLAAVPAEQMEDTEEELLALSKSWTARIPVEALDILIVDEIGKNISGSGMDTKVVNRGVYANYNPWSNAPRIERIFVRDLSEMTYGNAVGIGLADVITDRLLRKIDWAPTSVNSLAASTAAAIRTPMHFSNDQVCLEKIWSTVGKFNKEELTIGWIRNSLELNTLVLSENLLSEIRGSPQLEVLGPARELEFDTEGNLIDITLTAATSIG